MQLPAGLSAGFEAFLQHAALERGLSTHTLAAYRTDLAAYGAYLNEQGITDLTQVTGETLSEWVQAESMAGLSAASITRHVSTVRGLHRFLADEGRLPENVAARLRAPGKAKSLPKALTVDEVTALLEAAGATTSANPVHLRDRALLELLYASGARISEVCALDVDDLFAGAGEGDAWRDPAAMLGEGGFLRVTGKGSKQRIVPFGSYAGSALAAYLVRARPGMVEKGRGTPALFVGPRGGRLSRQSAWFVLQHAAAAAELTGKVSPHTMRHSFATHMLQGGADVRTVQELLGHASVQTTQIYTKVTADTLRESYMTAHPRAIHGKSYSEQRRQPQPSPASSGNTLMKLSGATSSPASAG